MIIVAKIIVALLAVQISLYLPLARRAYTVMIPGNLVGN
jgi:hypothetical protein